jgi:hypothetical protein
MKLKIIFILFLSTIISSCNLLYDSPDQVFEVIGLNANKIPRSFEQVFKEFRQHKANGSLQVPTADNKSMRPGTCVESVNYWYGNTFKEDIKKIKKLKVEEEVKPIITAALDLFQYADEIQKTDFLIIAKMIDEGKSEEEIDDASRKLDDTKGILLDKKYEKVMKLLLPYADENGVEYKTF